MDAILPACPDAVGESLSSSMSKALVLSDERREVLSESLEEKENAKQLDVKGKPGRISVRINGPYRFKHKLLDIIDDTIRYVRTVPAASVEIEVHTFFASLFFLFAQRDFLVGEQRNVHLQRLR